jgi:hypothetical protein
MAQRTRILIAEKDLNTLSRIYLALLHRNYKVEATNLTEEIADRTKRLKPSLTILGYDEYQIVKDVLKTSIIVLYDDKQNEPEYSPGDVVWLLKNVSIEKLISTIEEMVY